ncbi:hypothetical protein FQA39_LY16153 [Lamprigera yunnana]|nr:hypothetical protein FQA39_LY16153 [Lamprigera yunnana]
MNLSTVDCILEEKETQSMEVEDQFIIRLPLQDAETVRHALRTLKRKKFKKFMKISLDTNNKEIKEGFVKIKKQLLHAKLVSLPCIIDSNKTVDKSTMLKVANISKMLVCQREPFQEDLRNEVHPHGITPPLKNVKKQRFRKVMKNKENSLEIAEIEKELVWLLRADNDAVNLIIPICSLNKQIILHIPLFHYTLIGVVQFLNTRAIKIAELPPK